RVVDAIALSLRQPCDRLAPFKLAFAILQLGDGLLENMAEDVKADAFLHVAARGVIVAAAEIEERLLIAFERGLVCALPGLREYVVGNAQAVDERVRLKQTAVNFR